MNVAHNSMANGSGGHLSPKICGIQFAQKWLLKWRGCVIPCKYNNVWAAAAAKLTAERGDTEH